MNAKELTERWFHLWELGDFLLLPLSEDFKHTSPYGTIDGKKAYIGLVMANEDKFLGHRFEIHDTLYEEDKSCTRYTAVQKDLRLEVTEWHHIKDGSIQEVIAYYNIETQERKLSSL